jgi:tetrahydromethanopterin S-methyltransferase subunit B
MPFPRRDYYRGVPGEKERKENYPEAKRKRLHLATVMRYLFYGLVIGLAIAHLLG